MPVAETEAPATQSVGAQNTEKDLLLASLVAEAGALADGGHPLGSFFSKLAAFLQAL
jgi:hypothetical protein